MSYKSLILLKTQTLYDEKIVYSFVCRFNLFMMSASSTMGRMLQTKQISVVV